MTKLCQSIVIPVGAEPLYDYVTRPARWREWHHSSLEVRGVGDETVVAGRRFEESVQAAGGLHRELTWLVEESHPGKRWRASAYMADGSTVRLTYEFAEAGASTQFTRTLEYVVAPILLRWLEKWFLAGKVERESAEALARLQAHFAKAADR